MQVRPVVEAATAILLRPSVAGAHQVLLVQRSSTSSVFPSHFVFPGGLVEPEDQSPAWNGESRYKVAVLRETFEETGIILLRNDSQSESSLLSGFHSRDLSEMRKVVRNAPSEFPALFADLCLSPDLSGLHPWSRWYEFL